MQYFTGMLAKSAGKDDLPGLERSGEWIAEPKLDGIRFLCHLADPPSLLSRGAKEDAPKYPFIDYGAWDERLADTILDGEMCVMEDPEAEWTSSLHAVQSINGADPELSRERCASMDVRFVVFDVLRIQGQDLSDYAYHIRRDALVSLFEQGFRLPRNFRLITATPNIEAMLAEITTKGGEGIMLKKVDAPYTIGRSSTWLKMKLVEKSEGTIVGSKPGKGRNENLIGSFIVRGVDSGEVFKGCVGAMPDVLRAELSDGCGGLKSEWLGRKVVVKYYPGGINALRHCQLIKLEGWK
jgi:bifunctional non-homologous end joining protein LigD